jgi:Paraquat-inducible protein A
MKKYLALIISSGILLAATFYFTVRITQKLNNYKSKKEEVAEILSIENRMGDAWEWVPVSFLNPGDEKMGKKLELEQKADLYYSSAANDGWMMVASVLGFLVFILIFYRKSQEYRRAMGIAFVISAVAFLYLGLNAPMMEIEAYIDDFGVSMDLSFAKPELGITGRVYALYQMKSVLGVIGFLYTGGNIPVAIIILIFSIVFPALKLFSSLVVFIWPGSKYSKNAILVVEKLGKWSMADVFVAAVFLAFFSFSNMSVGAETGSSALMGLYFFFTFVVFSIFSGYFLKRVVKTSGSRKTVDDYIPA